ncbi:MAG: prenyltransferase/squalene oxidase repeat-containing protein [Blastocatellia bacterium]
MSVAMEEQLRSMRAARAFLISRQNADGGWGYVSGGESFPEPACYALLALADAPAGTDRAGQEAGKRALQWFARKQGGLGFLPLGTEADQPDAWGTLLTCFTMSRLGAAEGAQYREYLLSAMGVPIAREAAMPLKLDGSLRAWSWSPGTASWVEPTAYALLALKSQGLGSHARAGTGEAYLVDRVCYGGGWNYGNKEVLGVRLDPILTITAYALLALQDYDRTADVIVKSLTWLESEVEKNLSVMSLALGILCLDVYDRPVAHLAHALLARQGTDGGWRENVHLTALATLALAVGSGQGNVFRLPSREG